MEGAGREMYWVKSSGGIVSSADKGYHFCIAAEQLDATIRVLG